MRRPREPADIGLTGYDRKRLSKALHGHWDQRTYRRVLAVSCVARGYRVQQVASLMGTSLRSVYQWVDVYRQNHRVEDLQDRLRSGRPRTAGPLTDARIARELKRDPMKLGYQTTTWTAELLARHLAGRYDCPVSTRTLRRRLAQMGLVWKRPRHRYHKVESLPQKKGRSSGD